MNKKEIKIGFHSAFSEEGKRCWIDLLSQQFNPCIAEDYDYYIANEAIYWSHKNMQELIDSDRNAIRIFGCGEAVYTDLNIFDYGIWHCSNYVVEDRIIYDPLIRTEVGYVLDSIEDIDHSKDGWEIRDILRGKDAFCNFIYANPKSHVMRDTLFYEISKYKRVDSLGRHLKNVDILDTRDVVGWEKKSIELKRRYKFSIAAENAYFPGYTSEKIMTSMLANTIPIYWGNPYVAQEFNENAFINVNNYKDTNALLKKIKELDEDDEAYLEMMAQPWRTQEQIDKCQKDIDEFWKGLYHIFAQDKKEAARRPRGCWPDTIYSRFMQFEK